MWAKILFWKRDTWRVWWRRPLVYIPTFLAGLGLVLTWYLAFQVVVEDAVIMRYSIYVGTNWLAPQSWIYNIPITATAIVLIDLFLAYSLARTSLIIRYLLLWVGVFSALGFSWLAWLLLRINS